MGSGKRSARFIGLALFVVTGLVFAGVCGYDFVNYDDNLYVTQNDRVRAGLSGDGIVAAFTTPVAQNWHPLTVISLQLDAQLFGLRPWGYHLTNLLLHAANAVLLFLILRRMTGADAAAALAAALFAVHPLHVESVAWVSERKDVLSTCFGLLTLAAYIRYVERPGAVRYMLVLSAFAAGLMAKPMLVTWPCVLLLLDYWPLRRLGGGGHVVAAPVSLRFVLVEKLPLFALSAVACAVALHVQHQGGAIASLEGLPLSQRVANAVVSYVRYLSLTLWPANLAVFYPHPRDTLAAGLVAGAAGLLLGVTLAACLARRRCPYLLVGWLLYLGTLVPVIGLVQAGEQALADRYTYVPLIGLFVAAAWSLADLAAYRPRLRPAVVALAMAVLAVCVVRTVPQVAVWRDGRTLWEHALHVTDDNYVAHLNIGVWFRQHSDFARAEEHLRAALALRPHYGLAHYGLGVTLDLEGKTAEAVASYWQALPLLPEEPHLRNYLAVALAKQQDVEGAVAQFTEAVRLDPTFTEAYHNLAFALARLKRFEEARHYCAECVRLDPDRPQYRLMLAYLLRQCGAEADAREQERGASRLDGQSYR